MKHIALFLHDIHFEKRSGRLIFKREEASKYFFFRQGDIIQVKTNRPEERLGEILFKLERLPKEAHARIDDFIEPNQNIGEVLHKRGVISEEDLKEALAHQIRETILNAFPFFDGELVFQERKDLEGGGAAPPVNIPLLIEYGIRRMRPDPALKAFLADKIPSLKRTTYAYLLTAEEKGFLDKLAGTETAEAVIRRMPSPSDFYWKSLYLFACLDIVDLKGEARTAPAPDNRRPGLDPAATIDDVLSLREKLASRSYYQVLGVPRTASGEEVKKAYFQMARRFHPDRFSAEQAGEYKKQIDEVFDAITTAYRTLSDKALRAAYDAKSKSPAPEDSQSAAKLAEIKFRQGKTLFGQERYEEAISYLREAIREKKDKADYYLLLAMAEVKVPGYIRKAEEDFLKAINMEPWNPEGYLGLGMLYRREGLQAKALKMFEKAVQADPDHVAAREALEDLSGGGKKKGLKGLFSIDLFGTSKKKK